jgi:hypothetical protein
MPSLINALSLLASPPMALIKIDFRAEYAAALVGIPKEWYDK